MNRWRDHVAKVIAFNRITRLPARLAVVFFPAIFLAVAACCGATNDDFVFIHHSCGANWLNNSLNSALIAKDYIDERNDVYYGVDVSPDPGRPDSLGPTPGDNTNMDHWIRWFNDYILKLKTFACANGTNRIIMFKSCYPISNITADGTGPGDPFSSSQTLVNYKAVYRHLYSGNYTNGGYVYLPLEDVFAAHPDILFIPVTAPPINYAPSDATTDLEAGRARDFNNWLKQDWLTNYNARHPGYNNVAVFDWFNVLAYPADVSHPNRLRFEYGGASDDSHPYDAGNATSTYIFATCPTNFLDAAWAAFTNQDLDADNIPDWWERRYCANISTMTSSSDCDKDGFADVFEFRAGTDPTNSSSFFGFANNCVVNGNEIVVRWYSVDGKRYDIQRSTNLLKGFVSRETNIAATVPLNVYTDQVNNIDSAYYRVRLE